MCIKSGGGGLVCLPWGEDTEAAVGRRRSNQNEDCTKYQSEQRERERERYIGDPSYLAGDRKCIHRCRNKRRLLREEGDTWKWASSRCLKPKLRWIAGWEDFLDKKETIDAKIGNADIRDPIRKSDFTKLDKNYRHKILFPLCLPLKTCPPIFCEP